MLITCVVRLKHFGNGKGNYFVVSVMCSICIKIAVLSHGKILNLELNLKCGNQIHPECNLCILDSILDLTVCMYFDLYYVVYYYVGSSNEFTGTYPPITTTKLKTLFLLGGLLESSDDVVVPMAKVVIIKHKWK